MPDSFGRARPKVDLFAVQRLRAAAITREQARAQARARMRKPLTPGQVITRAVLALAAVPVLVRIVVVLFALVSLSH